MAEILLLHHAQGLTSGVESFAEDLRAAGHVVHAPDLYDGHTFDDLDDGVAYAEAAGQEVLLARVRELAEALPSDLVYAGFSLGAAFAQAMAQTRPGARAALLLHGALPAAYFGPWPDGVALQVHTKEGDPWVELDVARGLVGEVPGAELFLYPGDQHLFADPSLDAYDEAAARLLTERVLAFLAPE